MPSLTLEETYVELSRKPQSLGALYTRDGCVETAGARNDTYQADDLKLTKKLSKGEQRNPFFLLGRREYQTTPLL